MNTKWNWFFLSPSSISIWKYRMTIISATCYHRVFRCDDDNCCGSREGDLRGLPMIAGIGFPWEENQPTRNRNTTYCSFCVWIDWRISMCTCTVTNCEFVSIILISIIIIIINITDIVPAVNFSFPSVNRSNLWSVGCMWHSNCDVISTHDIWWKYSLIYRSHISIKSTVVLLLVTSTTSGIKFVLVFACLCMMSSMKQRIYLSVHVIARHGTKWVVDLIHHRTMI